MEEPCGRANEFSQQTANVLHPAVGGSSEPAGAMSDGEGPDSKKPLSIKPKLDEIAQLRARVLDALDSGRMSLKEAVETLGLSARHVLQLKRNWLLDGNAALVIRERKDKGVLRTSATWIGRIRVLHEGGSLEDAQHGYETWTKVIKPLRTHFPKRNPHEIWEMLDREYSRAGERVVSHVTVYEIVKKFYAEDGKIPLTKKSKGFGRNAQLYVKTRDGETIEVWQTNQLFQADHAVMTVYLLDDNAEVVTRRLHLTVVLDHWSSCVVGWYLSHEPASSKRVGLALRHAFLPKKLPAGEEPPGYIDLHGKCRYLFTDSGSDFVSDHLQQIATNLNFLLKLRARPSEGGKVERIFGTFRSRFFTKIPGHVPKRASEEQKVQAKADACLTLRELKELFSQYILKEYNAKVDGRKKNQSRYQLWEAGVSQDTPPELLDEVNLDVCLMVEKEALVYTGTRCGYVKFKYGDYKSVALWDYRGQKIALKYNPDAIQQIRLYRQEGEDQIFIGTAFREESEGQLSVDEAEAFGRKLKMFAKNIRRGNRAGLQMLKDLARFTESKLAERKRLDALAAYQQTSPAELTEQGHTARPKDGVPNPEPNQPPAPPERPWLQWERQSNQRIF